MTVMARSEICCIWLEQSKIAELTFFPTVFWRDPIPTGRDFSHFTLQNEVFIAPIAIVIRFCTLRESLIYGPGELILQAVTGKLRDDD